jgi:bacterioferritin (cytochrome b1)
MKEKLENPVIVITGMHRSGTSLVASLLQSAGIDIGQRLMNAGEGNIKGHFEDLDFVEFHESILTSQGFSQQGWILEKRVKVQTQYLEKGKEIINNRRKHSQFWGWKDPRTTLFLDFWREQIPEIFYIFLFRSPWEVIDSLYRRGDEVFLKNPNFAVDVWTNYNEIILDYHQKYPLASCIINIESIINDYTCIIKILEETLNMQLKTPKPCYEQSLFNHQLNSFHRSTIIKTYFPEAWDIYKKMCFIDQHDNFDKALDYNKTTHIKDWVLQDWIENKFQEKSIKKYQEEISNLDMSVSWLQERLADEEKKIEHLKNHQEYLEHEISARDDIINFMQASNFWKFREFWFKLKKDFNSIKFRS